MKRYVWVVGILTAVLILSLAAACGSEEKEETAPTATAAGKQATPTATPKETAAQPAAGLADIPIYPGAKSVQQLTSSVPGAAPGQEYQKVEWRYYTSNDTVAKVGDFYKTEMPKKGWKETLWMTTDAMAWGAYANKDDSVEVGVYVIKDESQNVTGIIIWRGEKKK